MCVKKLRRVIDLVDVFEPEDHNDHVDNWEEQVSLDRELASALGAEGIDELIAKLESIVSSMRRVRAGDFYFADDHNKFVDAWEVQAQINSLLKSAAEAAAVPCVPTILLEAEVTMPASLQGPMWLEEDVSGLGSSCSVDAVVEEGRVSMGESVSVEEQA